MENIEKQIFNYLANNLQLKYEEGKIRILLRNPDGYFKEITSSSIKEDELWEKEGRIYLSNDD